ncbi:MAG: MBL fold metallo-hydrolase, partial [Patescibacteria group bacterium]
LFLVRNLPKSYERDIDAWQWSRFCFVLCLMVGLFVLNIGVITWRSGRLNTESVHVFVFDVGQGDAAYIDGKEKDVIVDGGPTRTGLLENLSQVRYPWERHIDAVIATHPHADHVIGLIGLIGTYSVDEVVTSGVVHQEAGAEAFSSITSSPVIASATKQSWELSSEANLEILWPKNETDDLVSSNVHRRSIVLLLKVGEKSMLFTGDAEADVEKDLGDIGKIDVLKVGHHGSDTSTSQEFLNFINPDLAIISVGEGNSYGHPSPFVLARLSALGAEVLRTDQGGSIRVDFQNDDFSWWKLP